MVRIESTSASVSSSGSVLQVLIQTHLEKQLSLGETIFCWGRRCYNYMVLFLRLFPRNDLVMRVPWSHPYKTSSKKSKVKNPKEQPTGLYGGWRNNSPWSLWPRRAAWDQSPCLLKHKGISSHLSQASPASSGAPGGPGFFHNGQIRRFLQLEGRKLSKKAGITPFQELKSVG